MASSLSFPTSKSPEALASNPSFLESARPAILAAVGEHLITDLAEIIAGYAIQGKAFMAEDWERYGVEVEPLELGPEFYDWWFQPDAKDPIWFDPNVKEPTQLNCDTHFPPFLCPETLLETAALPPPALRHRFASYVDRIDYNLETLGRLVQNPIDGHPSKFAYRSSALSQNGKTKAGPACYIIARKELFARNLQIDEQRDHIRQVNAKTHAGYEVLPRALHLATVALVHHTVTGDRYLGDATGMEKCWSYGLCEDTIQSPEDEDRRCPVVVGGQLPFVPGVVGGPGRPSGGLDVYYSGVFKMDSFGVVGLRKFSGHRKLNT
jgi:hypothetical protein